MQPGGEEGKHLLKTGIKANRPQWLMPLVIFLVCLLTYTLLHLVFINRTGVNTTDGDEVHYLISTESLIDDRDLSPLNKYMEQVYLKNDYYQTEILSPMLVPGVGGRLVSNHLPTLPLLIAPGFMLAGYNGAAFTIIILFAMGAMFTFMVLRRFTGDRIAALVTLAFYLTYPAVTYSRLIYPETMAAILIPVALWASLRCRDTGRWQYALLAGSMTGLMFLFHNKFLALALAMGLLAWACSGRRVSSMVAWSLPVLVALGTLIYLTIYLYGPDPIRGITISAGPGDITGGDPFWGFFGLYLDRAWGLFIFAPLYFAFLPGMPIPGKWKDFNCWWAFIPIAFVLHTLVVGFFGQWHGGASPVPRYLVPLIPLMVLCAGLFLHRCRSRALKIAASVLLVFQLVLTVFALIHPLNVFGIHDINHLIPSILGHNWLSNMIVRLFPLFHPMTLKSGLLLIAWLVLLTCGSVMIRKRLMSPFSLGLNGNITDDHSSGNPPGSPGVLAIVLAVLLILVSGCGPGGSSRVSTTLSQAASPMPDATASWIRAWDDCGPTSCELEIIEQPDGHWASSASASSSFADACPRPGWSPEEATGPPDVPGTGIDGRAWGPGYENAGHEWLELHYEVPVSATGVRLRQVNGAGSVVMVELECPRGSYRTAWKGRDRANPHATWLVLDFPPTDEPVSTVRVTLDTTLVPGWQLIDAVQLVGTPDPHGTACSEGRKDNAGTDLAPALASGITH